MTVYHQVPPVEISALAAVMPRLLKATTLLPADVPGPRYDIVINRDDDQDTTEVRVYQDGAVIESERESSARESEPYAVVRFHVLDSGPVDDVQDHHWYETMLWGLRGAPDSVQTYVAEWAEEYHKAGTCPECTVKANGSTDPHRALDDLSTGELLALHAAAAERIEDHLIARVREELLKQVVGYRIAHEEIQRAVIPVLVDDEDGEPGQYDASEIDLYSKSGRRVEIDLSDVVDLVKALAAYADWRPAADGDPLLIAF